MNCARNNKKRLYNMAIDERNDLEIRYAAASKLQELNLARINSDKVRSLYLDGFTSWEIARELGEKHQLICGIIVKNDKWGM
ncbi:hypothetical protein E0485_14655 [Paenibacillus albiflavus]|uniref:Uncharacterized protein n=1 Tax=Paenibacillus albiflavus TaxID=2545760 RepID=A0A4R4E8H1_9BACL|nr:hypothetical protein [Paenibacillus albiflavus]TCZ76084.1 hypothetical protein E0485_14655 [Paenibacillus albiflavus]